MSSPDTKSRLKERALYGFFHALFLVLVLSNFEFGGRGLTRLIEFGEAWEDKRSVLMEDLEYVVKPNSHGYDGQFYAQIALDPTMRTEDFQTAIDGPAYRGRRILLPVMAWALGGGNPVWILHIYSVLNIGFWFLLSWLIFKFMPDGDPYWARFLRWFGVMFGVGVLDSVSLSLTDLPMLVLLLLSLLAFRSSRNASGYAAIGLALLARETALLGAIGQKGVYPPKLKALIKGGIMTVLAAVPLLVWIAYLNGLWGRNLWTGGNFSLPFVEMGKAAWVSVQALGQGDWDERYSFGIAAVVGFLVQLAVLIWHRQPRNDLWRLGLIYGVLMLCLGLDPWRGYWAVSRIVLPMTVAFQLLLPFNRAFLPIYILANVTIIHAIMRLV